VTHRRLEKAARRPETPSLRVDRGGAKDEQVAVVDNHETDRARVPFCSFVTAPRPSFRVFGLSARNHPCKRNPIA